MMKSKTTIVLAMMLGVLCISSLMAEEAAKDDFEPDPMAEMGPPEEMAMCQPMVGTWHYTGGYKMGPEQAEFTPLSGTAVISYVCGGAALQMKWVSEFMGVTMYGMSLSAYDRETKQWQEIWIDNFAGRISNYTGDFKDGKKIVTGKDIMQGKEFYSRMISSDFENSSFSWTSETSLDGNDWYVSMQGVYKRVE